MIMSVRLFHLVTLLASVGLTAGGSLNSVADTNVPSGESKRTNAHLPLENPQPGKPWENSLGMRFVPAPHTGVLFSIWETRVRDYEQFEKATARKWREPNFEQGPTHPAVNVSWQDAVAFCDWLTKRERTEGRLNQEQGYRLPTDYEWSIAVGLDPNQGEERGQGMRFLPGVWPWGTDWRPPPGSGNYGLPGYDDGYERTAPVGSFRANQFGLYDLSGNVDELCYEGDLRGGSWQTSDASFLYSSSRTTVGLWGQGLPTYGFRVVLDLGQTHGAAIRPELRFMAEVAVTLDLLEKMLAQPDENVSDEDTTGVTRLFRESLYDQPGRMTLATGRAALANKDEIKALLQLATSYRAKMRRHDTQANLKQIGLGIAMFADVHNGMTPASLDQLVGSFISTNYAYFLTDLLSGQRFVYIGQGKKWQDDPDRILAYTPVDLDGREVLFNDGHVQHLNAVEFKRALAELKWTGERRLTPEREAAQPHAANAATSKEFEAEALRITDVVKTKIPPNGIFNARVYQRFVAALEPEQNTQMGWELLANARSFTEGKITAGVFAAYLDVFEAAAKWNEAYNQRPSFKGEWSAVMQALKRRVAPHGPIPIDLYDDMLGMLNEAPDGEVDDPVAVQLLATLKSATVSDDAARRVVKSLQPSLVKSRRARSQRNLRQIGLGCAMYADNYNGMLPPSLDVLVGKVIGTEKILNDPLSGKRFTYIGQGKKWQDNPGDIIAYTPAEEDGRETLFNDGHVQHLSAAELGAALNAQQKRSK